MIPGVFFSTPQALWLLAPAVLLALFFLKRGKDRALVISRTLVVCLMIVALANPYVIASQTRDVNRPRITFLADDTPSTEIFDRGTAARLQAAIQDSQIRSFTGLETPLGDKVLQYAPMGETLVLVSDGYSNSGRPLKEALSLARASNTTVFAIQMEPVANDASVEISGTNTAVKGGDYPFTVVVRSADPVEGTLTVYADDHSIYQGSLGDNVSLKMSNKFATTGTHLLKAVISPSSDIHPINNEYQKAVYVVPKPAVFLLAEKPSPLETVLGDLFTLSTGQETQSSYSGYKAVVLDNRRYDADLNSLKDYVRDGGGLVVVGGPNSYELGGYYNSTFEEVLPVRSRPSTFEGGKLVVLIMDISGSTMTPMKTGDPTTFLDYEKSLSLELLKSPQLRDAQMGVVVFGTRAYVVTNPVPVARSRGVIEESIKSLQTPLGKDETNLDDGLRLAWSMINISQGDSEIVVISDGRLEPDRLKGDVVFENSARLIRQINVTTTLVQVQSFAGSTGRLASLASATGATFYPAIYPSSLTLKTGEVLPEEQEIEPEPADGYSLVVSGTDHYITQVLEAADFNVTLNGFNDVTPRPGGQRLVMLTDGKPILTAWRYGLGRVVCITTDDGNSWGQSLYAPSGSVLVSSAVNWAVGDPRPKAGRIDAEDGWMGTPQQITITSSSPPRIQADQAITVERSGADRYTATLTPQYSGVYYIGDFGIAVNYPLEYLEVGFNPELINMIESNGWRTFTEDEALSDLVRDARESSERTATERVSKRAPLLLLALTIFLVEVVWRRLCEVKRGR
ncbi:MAG: VWA domain-containing protein [Methanosarcinales archaeon]|nr:VWA domain-containing protein [Methanosarcinales archaeon]